MGAEDSRRQAERCMQLAEKTASVKLKGVMFAQARAWNCLAEDQEWLAHRMAERQSRETIARFPTLHAVLSAHATVPPPKRRR